MAERLPLFATTSRGTEDLLAAELTALGAAKVRQDRGGVRFAANWNEALRICLWSRIAMRILQPVYEGEAVGKDGLYEAAASVPWEEHLKGDTTFAIEATLKDSEHTHSGFVALRLKDGMVDRLRRKWGSRPDVDTQNPDVRIVAHLHKSKLSLSLDLCGEALFRRGYRARPTVAPLKETLAAAILAASGYTGEEPFMDPMCGSGTLAIEAGLIAIRRAPGLNFRFAVERWPHVGKKAQAILEALRNEARAQERKAPCPIGARDRDEEAFEAATRNIAAAKLTREIVLESADATSAGPPPWSPGLLASNPPYGDRLKAGGQKGMKTFYYKLGEALAQWQGWRMALLSGNEAFESAFHRRPAGHRNLYNGPISCELLLYDA